jgi:hypothetical protein
LTKKGKAASVVDGNLVFSFNEAGLKAAKPFSRAFFELLASSTVMIFLSGRSRAPSPLGTIGHGLY